MKSLLEQVEELDEMIRRMQKMESRCRSGQWIDVYRECCGIISALKRSKRELLANQIQNSDN